MKREGDKIIFDSTEQKQKLINMIDIGDEDFMLMLLRVMGKASRDRHKAWKFIVDELRGKGQIEEDETITLDYALNEFKVVKVDRDVKLGDE